MEGIVLLVCDAGKYHEVAKKVAKIQGVKKAFPCFGRWDAIAKIEGKDLATLTDVALKVNGTQGVRASETLIKAIV